MDAATVESPEKEGEGKAHPGPRGWFAFCGVKGQGKGASGGSVVLWGGGAGWVVDWDWECVGPWGCLGGHVGQWRGSSIIFKP